MPTPRGPQTPPLARPLYARQPGKPAPAVQRTETTSAFKNNVRNARNSLASQIAANAATKRSQS